MIIIVTIIIIKTCKVTIKGKDSSYLAYSDRKKLHGVRVSPKLSEWIGSTCFNEDFVKNYNKVTMLDLYLKLTQIFLNNGDVAFTFFNWKNN